ncbi:Uncharacterized protein APZ42_019542 [Daphnia magna]|uniref:Uncharacterized protein n=1 Tax=Daphnia magna TaxID=35525 RepID=A0A164Y987_9CRUS|nr:Uncharacterized protein APZ42_019542 [Daphnia magna]
MLADQLISSVHVFRVVGRMRNSCHSNSRGRRNEIEIVVSRSCPTHVVAKPVMIQ